MSLGDRINEIRRAKKISIDELCEKSGVPKGTLSKITAGITTSPTLDTVKSIARALECKLDDLDDISIQTKTAPLYSSEAMKIAQIYDSLDAHGQEMINVVSEKEMDRFTREKALKAKSLSQKGSEKSDKIITIRNMRHYLVPSAAGFASPVEGEDYEMIEAGPDVPPNADFCIDISGDSMEPYIHDGQRVYVQRDVDVREFDDAGIWYYAGNVYCKQYCVDFDGALILLSANPNREDFNIRIPKDERINVVCYGRVILPHKLPRPVYIS